MQWYNNGVNVIVSDVDISLKSRPRAVAFHKVTLNSLNIT